MTRYALRKGADLECKGNLSYKLTLLQRKLEELQKERKELVKQLDGTDYLISYKQNFEEIVCAKNKREAIARLKAHLKNGSNGESFSNFVATEWLG